MISFKKASGHHIGGWCLANTSNVAFIGRRDVSDKDVVRVSRTTHKTQPIFFTNRLVILRRCALTCLSATHAFINTRTHANNDACTRTSTHTTQPPGAVLDGRRHGVLVSRSGHSVHGVGAPWGRARGRGLLPAPPVQWGHTVYSCLSVLGRSLYHG